MKNTLQTLKKINYSQKIKEIYCDKNKYDLYDMIKKDISNKSNTRYKKNNFTYIETPNKIVYKFNKNELINIFSNTPINDEEIVESLLINQIKISPKVLKLFGNIPIKKINEIIVNYLKKAEVTKKEDEFIYLENKIEEVVLIFDYHNLYLENILNYDLSHIEVNHYLVLEKDKIKIIKKDMKEVDKISKLKLQLIYLDSYNYDINRFKKDILKNLKDYTINNNQGTLLTLYTEKYIYTVLDYNIISIRNKNNIPIPTKTNSKAKSVNLGLINFDFELNETFVCNNNIKKVYGNYIKAKDYLEKLGISIRVLTKFITEKNFQELFQFIISDLVYYGTYVYEDYLNNNSIILSNRFMYILKENVIIDIKTPLGEEIKECSLLFKPMIKSSIKKNNILNLDIKDNIRDFITYDSILSLKIAKHAKKRFNERVSKNDAFEIKEDIFKNDIYKYGEVMLGTYYYNSKLIKGKKFVYVITNNEIISIWKINDFIDSLGDRYFKKIKSS